MMAASFRPPVCGKQNLQSKNLPGAALFIAIRAGTSAIKKSPHSSSWRFGNFRHIDDQQFFQPRLAAVLDLDPMHVGPYRH